MRRAFHSFSVSRQQFELEFSLYSKLQCPADGQVISALPFPGPGRREASAVLGRTKLRGSIRGGATITAASSECASTRPRNLLDGRIFTFTSGDK